MSTTFSWTPFCIPAYNGLSGEEEERDTDSDDIIHKICGFKSDKNSAEGLYYQHLNMICVKGRWMYPAQCIGQSVKEITLLVSDQGLFFLSLI